MPENFLASTEELRQKILDDMCELGQWYLDDGDVDSALRWLETAASLGSANADYELGKMYYYGVGVLGDLAKAAHYFEKSGVYDDDIIDGFGDMFRYGRGVEKNIDKAIFFYEAERSREAIFALGEIYRDGEGGIQPDGEKAVEYFTELAFNTGDYFFVTNTKIYEDGQNVPMDYSESKYFLSFDTSNGDDKARFALGCMYLYGQAVKKDVYKAAWWFAKMYELECYDNGEVFELAEMYRTGDGVKKDVGVAVAWYKKIIECDYADRDKALFALAEIYFSGDGVERDIDKAIDFYRRASECGNVTAAYKLSRIYFDGDGIEQNLSEAQHFLDKVINSLSDKIEE